MGTPVLSSIRSSDRWLWIGGGAALVGVLAWSWWEILFLPLGDSHDGRINGRFGLHVRNLFDEGLVGSNFLSSIEPFTTQPYAHHPPLINLVHATVGGVLGQGAWQLHLVGFLSGLATVIAMLWLARELGFRPLTAVGIMALVIGTPMFWIYARLGFGMTPIIVFLAVWVPSRQEPRMGRWAVIVGAVVAFSSWPAAALVLVVGALGLREARSRALAIRVVAVGAVAVATALVWATLASSPSELVDHTANRVRLPVGLDVFVDQYQWFYRTLFPSWFRWAIPVTVVASLVSVRTRLVSGSALVVLVAWTVGLPEAAFVHDYWTYPLLASVALGGFVLLEWLVDQQVNGLLVGGAVAVLALGAFSHTQDAGFREAYFEAPAAAGRLLGDVDPPTGQEIAWVSGIELPRWVSFYWDLPASEIDAERLDDVHDDDLVLLRLDRVPAWVEGVPTPVASEGRYALVRAAALRAP